ncbi:MAG: hypothetical protein PUE03_01570 [Prevotella sp.]|nr:hypothetical protein [Prevotella sp.]
METKQYFEAEVTNLTFPTFYEFTNSSEMPSLKQSSQLRQLMGVYAQVEQEGLPSANSSHPK